MKEPFVQDVVSGDRAFLPGIVDQELKDGRLRGLRCGGEDARIEVKLHGVGHSGDERHPASAARALVVRPHVGIHRADVDDALGGIGCLSRCGDGLRHLPRRGLGATHSVGCSGNAEAADHERGESSRVHKYVVDPGARHVKDGPRARQATRCERR
jgi:hypothetical protein